jgi:hypothetical protein
MTELELMELKLKVIQLEKEKLDNDELVKLLTRAVNSFATFQDQFKNGDGIVPKIITGLTNNFKSAFEEHKKEMAGSFQIHEEKVATTIALIPCSKLLGDGCLYKLISKDDPVPEGWKAKT